MQVNKEVNNSCSAGTLYVQLFKNIHLCRISIALTHSASWHCFCPKVRFSPTVNPMHHSICPPPSREPSEP